jgi:PAS domain S-box-containing protein
MEQELGDGWAEGVHPDDLPRCLHTYRDAFDRRVPFTMDYRLRRADGEYRWILDRGVACFMPDGSFAGYIGACIDITERKAAETALVEREARLQAILNNEPECVKLVDLDGRILEMNPAGVRMAGAAAFNDLRGRPALDLVHPDDRALYRHLHDSACAGRGQAAGFRIVDLAGAIRHVESHAAPLRDAGGAVTAVLSVTRDVTQRVELEAARARSEAQYRLIFERNVAGVFYSSLDGTRIGCNEAFARILGYDSPEEVSAVPAQNLYVHPGDRDRFLADLRRTGAVSGYELAIRRRDGSTAWIIENTCLISPGPGEPEMIFGTLIDITARKQAEAQARASSDILRQPRPVLRSLPRRDALPDRERVRLHRRGAVHAGRRPLPEDSRPHQHRLERRNPRPLRGQGPQPRVLQPHDPVRRRHPLRPARHRQRPRE